MKKIIYICALVFLSITIIVNLLFTANLDSGEHITINYNSLFYIISLIILGVLMFVCSKFIDKKLYNNENLDSKKKVRKILFIVSIAAYMLFTILWTIFVRPAIVGDQIHACNLAQTFYRNNAYEFLPNLTYAGIPLSDYMQAYHQQISLAFVYSLFFRIIHFDGIGVLRVLNVIGIAVIIFSLYKITNHLSKKYKVNRVLMLVLSLTFISLPMLSTFIYGDIPSLALCLLAVYLTMKYTETKNIKYIIIASIFTMFAYMMRMNSLIFIIATTIYLLLNLFNEFTKKAWKEKLLNVIMIALYIVISIVPTTLVQNYYLNKYDMDKNKSYPMVSYILMAMSDGSYRGNGWYDEGIGEPALKNPEIKTEYVQRIKDRLIYFSQNIGYTFEFYTSKITSMWAENTYSAIRSNLTMENDPLENIAKPLTFYQKVLLIVTCICSLIVLIQNRKNLSLELIFLFTIFIGGFAFHILWEAKSRYIIPYIVVLIPAASIAINNSNIKSIFKKEKINKEKTNEI